VVNIKVFGSAWSPRHGNTEILVKEALKACRQLPGVETSFWSLTGKTMAPCDSCFMCFRRPNPQKPCPAFTDAFDEILPLVAEADALLIGFPVYYMGVPAQLKAMFDRSMAVESLGHLWRSKVAGFVTVGAARHGGHESALTDAHNWALMHDLITVGVGPERDSRGRGGYLGGMALQGYPRAVSSMQPEGLSAVLQDTMGLQETRFLSYRLVEVAKVVKAGYQAVEDDELRWGRGPIESDMIRAWKGSSAADAAGPSDAGGDGHG